MREEKVYFSLLFIFFPFQTWVVYTRCPDKGISLSLLPHPFSSFIWQILLMFKSFVSFPIIPFLTAPSHSILFIFIDQAPKNSFCIQIENMKVFLITFSLLFEGLSALPTVVYRAVPALPPWRNLGKRRFYLPRHKVWAKGRQHYLRRACYLARRFSFCK